MVYLYIDKLSNEMRAFGSVVALSKITGLKKDRIYYHFGRLKKKAFENNDFKIVKLKVFRSSNDKNL